MHSLVDKKENKKRNDLKLLLCPGDSTLTDELEIVTNRFDIHSVSDVHLSVEFEQQQ